MLVQDRVLPEHAGSNKSPKSPRAAPGSDRRHPRPFAKSLDFSNWASEHSSKLLLLLFAVASVAAVFLLRGAGPDAAALLCLDRSNSRSASGPTKLPRVLGGDGAVPAPCLPMVSSSTGGCWSCGVERFSPPVGVSGFHECRECRGGRCRQGTAVG